MVERLTLLIARSLNDFLASRRPRTPTHLFVLWFYHMYLYLAVRVLPLISWSAASDIKLGFVLSGTYGLP